MAIKSETELYAPVKSFMEQLGYEVRGEVRHCDVVAVRGEEPPIIVELKKSFSIPLLLQAIDRLKLSRSVYVAFEKQSKGRAPHGATWPELRRLCGMLGIGMLTVQFYKTRKPRVEAECHPPVPAVSTTGLLTLGGVPPRNGNAPRPSAYAARKLKQEFQERQGDYNVGGSTRRKLVTAYREKSLQLAWLLRQHGPSSPRRLRDLTGNSRAAGMLQKNVYLWFARVERGVYRLTPQGEEALVTYAHVVQGWLPSGEAASAQEEAVER